MNAVTIIDLTRSGLMIVLVVSLPAVLVALITSLAVAIAQTVTQVQDQSLGQAVRTIAVRLAIMILAAWGGQQVLQFARQALRTLPGMA